VTDARRAPGHGWHDADEHVGISIWTSKDGLMKQRLVATTLCLGLLMTLGGGAVAQGPTPEATQAAPSYQPAPAADPVAAVNAFLDAFVEKRWTTLPGLVCAAGRDAIARNYDPSQQDIYPRDATWALVDAVQVSISDRTVTLVSSTADQATARLGGTLVWNVSDDALRTFVDALAAAAIASPKPSQEQRDSAFQMFKDSIASQILVTDVPVVAEGGGWLLCADIVTTRPPTPAPSPAG
jgi:hypothetical protein